VLKPLLASFALLLVADSASAYPTVSVNWGSCPFSVGGLPNRDAHTGPIETISVTVKGLSGMIRGAQVRLTISAGSFDLPEAWRYDVDGCESGRLRFNAIPVGDSCPFLDGTNPAEFATFEYVSTRGRAIYARAYDAFVADPNQTYTLARFDFEHSAPDTCGCIERPLCIHITSASYLDGTATEISFASAQEFVLWNDPNNTIHCPSSGPLTATLGDDSCDSPPTPAITRSWGSVKATYR
jgi:hypothetical protein